MNEPGVWDLIFNHQIFRCEDGELAQVQVDGDDVPGKRHDGACGRVERADDFSSAIADGHRLRGDDVVVRADLVKVAGFAHDDILWNLDVC